MTIDFIQNPAALNTLLVAIPALRDDSAGGIFFRPSLNTSTDAGPS